MKTQENLFSRPIRNTSLIKWSLLGGAFGFLLMMKFLFGVHEPNPEWPKYWMARPLVVITIAGAMGGAGYYLVPRLRIMEGRKVLAVILGLVVFLAGLFFGAVLGMDGTLWD